MDLRARTDDADLVRAAQAGDGQAFGALFDRWSARVVDVAYRIVRDREVAAEVAQDAFLAAWTGLDRLERAESFGGWVLRIGRNRALNRLERERRSIPVGDEEATEMLDRDPRGGGGSSADDAADALARAEDAELVWAAAAALGPRDASLLDLHLRHGLAPAEIAEELGVTANAAHQALFRLRARLGDAVRACVLWRAGRPTCPSLADVVAAAGVTDFGSDAVRLIGAHTSSCPDCAGRQEARLSPEALFAAVPLLVVAPEVLAAIRSGLADAGVPVGALPEPTPDSAAEHGGPPDATAPPSDGPADPGRVSARRPAALAAAAGLLVLVVVAILLLGDDGTDAEEVAADGPATSTSAAAPSSSSTSRPGSSASSSTTTPGVSSLPAPAPAPDAPTSAPTTGPSADIGATSEPPLAPNPPTPTTAPPRPTTTTSTTTTQPGPAPPTISGFTVGRSPGAGTGCLDPSHRVAFVWQTVGADVVRITGRGAPTASLAPSGTATGCAVGAVTYTLTATGPGGTTTRPFAVPA